VDASWVGRRVVVHLGPTPDGGAYARLVAAPVENLHALPDGLDPAHAIAMVGTGRTALMVLEVAAIRPDDVVIVTAAAGGLGSLLVQSALETGARVLALAGGPAKVRALRSLAPDAGEDLAVVDSRAPRWREGARDALGRLGANRADVVLDGVGGVLGTGAAHLLRPGGRLVVHGWASGEPNDVADDPHAGIDVRPVVGPGAPQLGDLRTFQERALARAAGGRWRVLVHRVPFAEAARAHRELEERRTTGKVVLV
jgi:NADPH2:quinone reductase